MRVEPKLPSRLKPSEKWTSEELDQWLKKMVRWHLLSKRYEVRNGEGDWYYKDTILGKFFVMPTLQLLTRLGLLKEEDE